MAEQRSEADDRAAELPEETRFYFAQTFRAMSGGDMSRTEITGWSDDYNISLNAAVNMILTNNWDLVMFCRYTLSEGIIVIGRWVNNLFRPISEEMIHRWDRSIMQAAFNIEVAKQLKHKLGQS